MLIQAIQLSAAACACALPPVGVAAAEAVAAVAAAAVGSFNDCIACAGGDKERQGLQRREEKRPRSMCHADGSGLAIVSHLQVVCVESLHLETARTSKRQLVIQQPT